MIHKQLSRGQANVATNTGRFHNRSGLREQKAGSVLGMVLCKQVMQDTPVGNILFVEQMVKSVSHEQKKKSISKHKNYYAI